jgi:hypothetical protein
MTSFLFCRSRVIISTRQLCFAGCPMKASIIAIGIAVALVIPAHAIECQLSKGARGYHWAWREIDGRRCWYEGGRGMAKSELHWPAPPHAVEPRSTEPSLKSQLHSPTSADLAPPLTEPSPRDQTTLSYWKRNGDRSLIETGTSIHVLQIDPPSIPQVIAFDGTLLAMRAPLTSANASFGARWSAWQGDPNVRQIEGDFSR